MKKYIITYVNGTKPFELMLPKTLEPIEWRFISVHLVGKVLNKPRAFSGYILFIIFLEVQFPLKSEDILWSYL